MRKRYLRYGFLPRLLLENRVRSHQIQPKKTNGQSVNKQSFRKISSAISSFFYFLGKERTKDKEGGGKRWEEKK